MCEHGDNKKEVQTFLFDGYYILALDKKWAQVLGEPLTFTAAVDKHWKLHLISTKGIPGHGKPKRKNQKK
ncbi:MAG: hypothetical protein ABI342_04195 [Nitrososphaera sp.]